jgi:hypothetical protein
MPQRSTPLTILKQFVVNDVTRREIDSTAKKKHQILVDRKATRTQTLQDDRKAASPT